MAHEENENESDHKDDHHKLPQKVAVYVETDPEGKYHCQDCMMFIPDTEQCTAVVGSISPVGGCAFWMKGPPATLHDLNPNRFSHADSVYEVQPKGFGCARCRNYIEKDWECIRVEGKLKPKGCCNGWQEKVVSRHETILTMMRE